MLKEITEEKRQARRKALLLLEHMDRTEKGLLERLLRSGFSREAAEDAVSYVKGYGYIDDDRYARNYISYRIHDKSRQKIFQELLQKGISRDSAEEAWEAVAEFEEPDEREILKRTIMKRAEPGARLDQRGMRRLYGYLSRRGFRQGEISSVLDELEITVDYSE